MTAVFSTEETHGRRDLSCPLGTAWDFAKAWPDCELVVVDDAGHRAVRR